MRMVLNKPYVNFEKRFKKILIMFCALIKLFGYKRRNI